jgi:Zn finger protein HypA/HybF involved in hydrogenase expression
VREPFITQETWHYECRCCLAEWQDDCEVWRVSDGLGGEAVLYLRDGHRSTSPLTDVVCPRCHGCSVTTLPHSEVRRRSAVPKERSNFLDTIFTLRRLQAY